MRKGYITAYLALSLTLILSLLFTVIEGARISAIRMRFECVADIGMNSVLAEYHRELLEQYDLLFVDSSYGRGTPAIANTEDHLKNYIRSNLTQDNAVQAFFIKDFLGMNLGNADITECSIASDQNGEVLKRQVSDYMADYPLGAIMESISSLASEFDQYENRDIDAERKMYEDKIKEIGTPTKKSDEDENKYEEVPLDNPADVVNGNRYAGILGIVLSNSSAVSNVKVNALDYISHRQLSHGTGVCAEAQSVAGVSNELLFQQYLMEKCGYFGQEMDKSKLKYQIEYILSGEDTDWMNLEKTVKRLVHIREAANLVYILSDEAKKAEAQSVAAVIAAVTLCPELLEPVTYTLLYAWAYVESLQDAKILLTGGRVPVAKTSSTWKTKISALLNIKGSLVSSSGNESGMSYKDYLQVLLFMQNRDNRTMRAMDIMEMDIRKTPGNSRFRMDGCFDTYTAEISVISDFGYQYRLKRLYGYY